MHRPRRAIVAAIAVTLGALVAGALAAGRYEARSQPRDRRARIATVTLRTVDQARADLARHFEGPAPLFITAAALAAIPLKVRNVYL